MVTVRHILHVATDDGHRYTENLLAFRVNLEESLATSFLVLLITLQITDDGLTFKKSLLLLFVEQIKVALIEFGIEKHIDTSFWSAYQTEPCTGSLSLTILGGNSNR